MRVSNYRIFHFGWTTSLSNFMGFYCFLLFFIFFQSVFLHCPLSFRRMHNTELLFTHQCQELEVDAIYLFIFMASEVLTALRLWKRTEINSRHFDSATSFLASEDMDYEHHTIIWTFRVTVEWVHLFIYLYLLNLLFLLFCFSLLVSYSVTILGYCYKIKFRKYKIGNI